MAVARSEAVIQHSSSWFIRDSSGGGETVAVVGADDVPRTRKVRSENQRARIGMALDELTPRDGGALAVVAEAARPLGLGDLDDPVHEITREDGLTGCRGQPHAHMTR